MWCRKVSSSCTTIFMTSISVQTINDMIDWLIDWLDAKCSIQYVFCVKFCISLFVRLSFYFVHCSVICDFLITPLVSSNLSLQMLFITTLGVIQYSVSSNILRSITPTVPWYVRYWKLYKKTLTYDQWYWPCTGI